jgi:phage shock protein A
MEVVVALLVVLAIVVVVLLLLNKPFCQQLLVKFRGRTDEIMRQDASTPEGAKDYYNHAIREKEELYTRASATYSEISGKLDTAEKELYRTNKDIMKVTQQLNLCIDGNNDADAMTYANKKVALENKVEILKETIAELKEGQKNAKEIRDQSAVVLQNLREEKEQVIFQLEADQQSIELHQSLDNLALNSESDRMLERVREGAKKTRERAKGSKIAYETSAQAADNRLKNAEQNREAQRIVEEAKRQRGKQ